MSGFYAPFNKSWSYYESIDKRSGSSIRTHNFRTTTHSWIQEMEKLWYKTIDGKRIKVIPNEIADWMDETVLAVWFMDDGSTDWTYRNGIKEWKNAKPIIKICTDSFTKKDTSILLTVMNLKFNIKGYIGDRNRIYLDTENTEKFINLTKAISHKDLLYKFDENVYSELM